MGYSCRGIFYELFTQNRYRHRLGKRFFFNMITLASLPEVMLCIYVRSV